MGLLKYTQTQQQTKRGNEMLSSALTGFDTDNQAAAMTNWLGDGGSAKIKFGQSLTTTNERQFDTYEHLFVANNKWKWI